MFAAEVSIDDHIIKENGISNKKKKKVKSIDTHNTYIFKALKQVKFEHQNL